MFNRKKNRISKWGLLIALMLPVITGYSSDSGNDVIIQKNSDTILLTLERARQIALEENPIIQAAKLGTWSAEYKLNEARGNLLPNFSLSGTYTKNMKLPVMYFPGFDFGTPGAPEMEGGYMEIGRPYNYRASFSGSMALFSPAIYANIRANRIELERSEQEFRGSKIDLDFDVQQAFFNALLTKETKEVVKLSYQNAQENLEQINIMYSQGLVSEYDKIRAKVQTENLKPEVMEMENTYNLTVNYLKTLIGIDRDQPVQITGDLLETTETYTGQFQIMEYERILANNPDIRQMGLTIDMMKEQSKAIMASAMPSLYAMGNYNYQADEEDLNFSDYFWAESFSAGLQLSIPLFQGFTVRNRAKQIDIAAKQINLQKEYLEDNLKIQLDNILKKLNVAVEKSTKASQNIGLAQRGYEIAKTRYASGQGTLLEINDSELALTRARFNHLQAKYEILMAIIEYEKFVGKEF